MYKGSELSLTHPDLEDSQEATEDDESSATEEDVERDLSSLIHQGYQQHREVTDLELPANGEGDHEHRFTNH